MNTPTAPWGRRHGDLIVGGGLALAVFAVYWGIAGHPFVNYDDPLYVTENPHLIHGLSWAGIRWAATTLYANFWHPLTWLTYLFDYQLYGLRAGGYLLTNLILHGVSALVLYAVLIRMTGARVPSAVVAALFALHPIGVESVAWVAERKNVLSTVFWMATLWCYARYAERPGPARYALVAAAFVFGLMAKPMLVTLPCVMLLLDIWPLGRWAPLSTAASTLPRLIAEKLPFFAIAAGFSVIAYIAQDRGGALPTIAAYPMDVRVANALVSYAVYLRKLVWPTDLAVFYPHPGMPPVAMMAAAGLVLGGISLAALWRFRTQPWLMVGWLWYLGTLVPVSGLVQIGQFAMADRFAYVPMVGVFIMAAWGTVGPAVGGRGKRTAAVCWLVVLAALAGATHRQAGTFADSTALFTNALRVSGPHPLIYHSLGEAREAAGDVDGAISDYRRALRMDPGNAETLSNLGAALMAVGNLQGADAALNDALRRDPALKKGYVNLGNLYARQGRLAAAAAQYRKALALDPYLADAYNNLGVALARRGERAAAVVQFQRALELRPAYDSALRNMAYYGTPPARQDEEPEHVR